jgi:dolichyl-phosphate-mannose--protein O-mannosyl transferase
MVGLFLVALIGFSVIYDLWNLLDINYGLTMVSSALFQKDIETEDVFIETIHESLLCTRI